MAHSPYAVRFYGRVLGPKDFEPWARELSALLIEEGVGARTTMSMSRVGPKYPILHELETNWTRLPEKNRVGIILDPLMHLLGDKQPRDAF